MSEMRTVQSCSGGQGRGGAGLGSGVQRGQSGSWCRCRCQPGEVRGQDAAGGAAGGLALLQHVCRTARRGRVGNGGNSDVSSSGMPLLLWSAGASRLGADVGSRLSGTSTCRCHSLGCALARVSPKLAIFVRVGAGQGRGVCRWQGGGLHLRRGGCRLGRGWLQHGKTKALAHASQLVACKLLGNMQQKTRSRLVAPFVLPHASPFSCTGTCSCRTQSHQSSRSPGIPAERGSQGARSIAHVTHAMQAKQSVEGARGRGPHLCTAHTHLGLALGAVSIALIAALAARRQAALHASEG